MTAAMPRRAWLASLASVSLLTQSSGAADALVAPRIRRRIGVSTYSMWQFRHEAFKPIDRCIDLAADLGFDGVEILLRQLDDTSDSALQAIKRHAFLRGLPLMGLSTHQDFVDADPAKREENVKLTLGQIEIAHKLGIPTMRINTGRWGTSKDFDELMKNRGVEPPTAGNTEEEAFGWVIESMKKLTDLAAARGVLLGLENHWGLGLTPEGVLRIVEAVNSPWLQVTLDTGNFLEDPYPRLAKLAPRTVLVQAKTYFGGGRWYTLDLDYPRIGKILDAAAYRGWVSLEFAGNAPVEEGLAQSLALLRGVL
jgi:sugar phosphate isomerase/epimerase